MEDSLSVRSYESGTTSEEYEILAGNTVNRPQLHIADDGSIDDLRKNLREVLSEDCQSPKMENSINNAAVTQSSDAEAIKIVGKSIFYNEDSDISNSPSNEVEKEDTMKNEELTNVPDVQQECTIFNGVTYLGSAAINAPKSEAEIQRNMAILNEQSIESGIKISVSVPSSSDGTVVLYDAATNAVMAQYEIHRILYYSRGTVGTKEAPCFAFTWSHGESHESAIFQCHVFRCDIPEAVGQVSGCFSKAFQRVPKSLMNSVTSLSSPAQSDEVFIFQVTMAIKEDDGHGNFSPVARDRSHFKLRVNMEKKICLTVQQASEHGKELEVERCFGVLISPGRYRKHSDLQLLEMEAHPCSDSGDKLGSYLIYGHWDPTEPAFESLNNPTLQDYLTVAVDLVIKGIQEPVRFIIETQVRIFSKNERFWYHSRRPLTQQFNLHLKEIPSNDLSETLYEVMKIESSGNFDETRRIPALTLAYLTSSPAIPDLDNLTPSNEELSDGDEPLLSGTGSVSKDCSEVELESWAEVLLRWSSTNQRPRQLAALVRAGIPEALRGEVWQRLACCDTDTATMDTYRILITKDSPCETVIQRDINRTFPAHDFFKEAGGLGQDSLYRISKAYAVYDTEVGYCQGLSFLAATLLLHMPEEQAFCVLIKLMYNYGLRDLYKDGFDVLYLRLYQLDRLMEEQLPKLWQHFTEKGVESHMFASQWFLTVFTARFPLYFVFHILDVFLLQGVETLFQVALALLMVCKKELLTLDFETTLKYFRVSLPKKCRSEEVAKNIMKLATSLKVKKLKKYEQEFISEKEAQEAEKSYASRLEFLQASLQRSEEEKRSLEEETLQIKEMLQREVQRAENESCRNNTIITEYKQICQRLDAEKIAAKLALQELRAQVKLCNQCRKLVCGTEEEVTANTGTPAATIDPQLQRAQERIRELELELAQTKLARVQAECLNQDLLHKLHTAITEAQMNKTTWPPWFQKTLSSIKEVAKKDLKDVNIKIYPKEGNSKSEVSGTSPKRRDSAPPFPRDSYSRDSLFDASC
ncbi:rab GTPase-activating protein 1-like [Schistocerca cancellata]|uniref:rab GTPase-activating protein 1-like n=1 Tax=Schistocerca cancellata TaxID=274614 RepID=UPI00211950D5|nr:rab GTPase-activating protein 1-like [Schistocerca cancellata]